MVREILLYFLICLGAILLGRHSLFNFKPLIVAYLYQEDFSEEPLSEKRHALFAAGILLILFAIISMLLGLELFFVKIFVLSLFFIGGLLLGVQKDLFLLERSEALYIEKERRRIKHEFFFWAAIVALIFILSLFVFV